MLRRLIFSLIIFTTLSVVAQDNVVRPVLSAYTIEIGGAQLADTYLSPLKYSGAGVGLSYERMQAMRFSPDNWVMELHGKFRILKTNSPIVNHSMWNMDFNISWGMMHRWKLSKKVGVYFGPATTLDMGVNYNSKNSNNPATAKVSWTIDMLGAATYKGKIGKIPYCARLQMQMPVTGIFFAPEYGELYYEIYMGNHSGLVRAVWPGNFFRLNNLLSIDLNLGGTSLRLGYRFDVSSVKASEIVSQRIEHIAVIGVTTEWISLKAGSKQTPNAKIVNPMY